MADIHIVRDYPHPPAKVWRAVTDPDLIPLWTATGQGGRPVGFAPVPGTRFQLVAKPVPGWRGIVYCEVLEVREPSLLRFSWAGEEGGKPTYVSYRIEPHGGGTRFTYDHTGFTGLGGFFMAKLLGSVRKKMLTVGLPAVLDDLDDAGTLRASVPSGPTYRAVQDRRLNPTVTSQPQGSEP
jgi:uncharacterized protein YndB with AHSA1/START domain